MTTDHTPEPWTVEPCKCLMFGQAPGNIGSMKCTEHLCVNGPEALFLLPLSPADAHVIAASQLMLEALEAIAKAEGRFSRDPLEHAASTIEDMVAIATAAIAKAKPC